MTRLGGLPCLPRSSSTSASWSTTATGPRFVEPIEAQHGDGIYSRAYGQSLHHVALWEGDLDARLAELAAEGVAPECTLGWSGEQTVLAAYLPPEAGAGTRVELIRRLPEMPGYTPELPGA